MAGQRTFHRLPVRSTKNARTRGLQMSAGSSNNKSRHRSLNAHRLADNPEERRISAAWAREQEHGRVLDYILHPGDQHQVSECSGRDAVVAATVIQWLGSSVGQSFLRELGYERAPGSECATPHPITVKPWWKLWW